MKSLTKLLLEALHEEGYDSIAQHAPFVEFVSSKLSEKGVIVLPRKIGDIVYVISNRQPWAGNHKEIIECEVMKVHIKNDNKTVVFSCRSTDYKVSYQGNFNASSIDKTVFDSYKEAEEYLRKEK